MDSVRDRAFAPSSDRGHLGVLREQGTVPTKLGQGRQGPLHGGRDSGVQPSNILRHSERMGGFPGIWGFFWSFALNLQPSARWKKGMTCISRNSGERTPHGALSPGLAHAFQVIF